MSESLLSHRDRGTTTVQSPDRLNIYRNTFLTGVTKALRLSYPAVDLTAALTAVTRHLDRSSAGRISRGRTFHRLPLGVSGIGGQQIIGVMIEIPTLRGACTGGSREQAADV